MSKTSSTKKDIPAVLAFEKKIVPSDGRLYGLKWNEEMIKKSDWSLDAIGTPLANIAKTVRGSFLNRTKSDKENLKSANIQTVDSCMLGSGQDALGLSYTLKFLGNLHTPSTCDSTSFADELISFVGNFREQVGFVTLAQRYAVNIANARYLWRNRVGAEDIRVRVTFPNDSDKKGLVFNAFDYSLSNFDTSCESVQNLAGYISEALASENGILLLKVEAVALIGEAQEVYPSEELVPNSSDKKLYAVQEQAALHSQKIGNAIRTVDTWYPGFDDTERPIAVEVYGTVTQRGEVNRAPKNGDFYTYFDRFMTKPDDIDWTDANTQKQLLYTVAVLIRGGVFGKSSKD